MRSIVPIGKSFAYSVFALHRSPRSDRQYLPSMRSTNPRGSPYQLPLVGIPMVW